MGSMVLTVYEDEKGDLYRVSSGLTDGTDWMTVRIGHNGRGSQHRVKSKNLPLRKSRKEGQADLDKWAKGRGLRVAARVGGES